MLLYLHRADNISFFFFFNDTATPEIYPLSLHDALPISPRVPRQSAIGCDCMHACSSWPTAAATAWLSSSQISPSARPFCTDRKSTRLNSSHSQISYAVFCLKKKKSLFI